MGVGVFTGADVLAMLFAEGFDGSVLGLVEFEVAVEVAAGLFVGFSTSLVALITGVGLS